MPTLHALLRGDVVPTARDCFRPHTRAAPSHGGAGALALRAECGGGCVVLVPKVVLFAWSDFYRMRLRRHGGGPGGAEFGGCDDDDGVGPGVSGEGLEAFGRFCREGRWGDEEDAPQFLEDDDLRSRLRVAHDLALVSQEKLVPECLARSEEIVEEMAELMGPEFVQSVVEEHPASFFTENVASYAASHPLAVRAP